MPDSKRTKHKLAAKRLNAASIVQRLPFHQQLNASQSLILKVTPIWHDWCEQQRSRSGAKHFAAASDTSLTSFENGILTLACSNTSTATALKHQQTSLLAAFQEAGVDQIKRIRVRMALSKATTPGSEKLHSHNSLYNDQPHRQKPSDSSIKSVEAVQSRIKNEHLANSLKQLADTLKKQ